MTKAIKIQVRCRDQFHDIYLHPDGQLAFPSHQEGVKELRRMLNFEELGGQPTYGCHKILLAWQKSEVMKLPDKLQEARIDAITHGVAIRIFRRWQRLRRKDWLPTPDVILQANQNRVDRNAFTKTELPKLIAAELRRRRHDVQLGAEMPEVISGIDAKQVVIVANYIPANSIAATIKVGTRYTVSAVQHKNVRKAVEEAADLAERSMLQDAAHDYIFQRSENQLYRKAVQAATTSVMDRDAGPMRFFKLTATINYDSLSVEGVVPGPLTTAAARCIMRDLVALEKKFQKLRTLSKERIEKRGRHAFEP